MMKPWPMLLLVFLASSPRARPPVIGQVRPSPRDAIASQDTSTLVLVSSLGWDSLTIGDTSRVILRDAKGSAPSSSEGRVRWSIFNTNVVTIDSTGLLRAISLGTATVVARTPRGLTTHLVTVVPFRLRLAQITTGMSGTCALTTDGGAVCWGEWAGVSFTPEHELPTRVKGPPLIDISVGMVYSCGVDRSGSLGCSGMNSGGQLGLGYANMFATGVVHDVGLSAFRSVSAGIDYACGIASDSTGYCWGTNDSGQVGATSLHESCKPLLTQAPCTTLPVQLPPQYHFVGLVAGYYHTCGVLTDRSVVCWGGNSDGQLGDGTYRSSATPVRVAGNVKFSSVTVGATHSCGVAVDGRGYCWGSNRFGELGVGDEVPRHNVPTPIVGVARFLSLSATGANSSCGLTEAHTVACWGLAEYSVVDSADARDQCTDKIGRSVRCARHPVAVADTLHFTLLGRSLGSAICALDAEGRAFCWGFGSGNGSIHHCDLLPSPTLIGDGPICAERVRVD